MNPYSCKCGGKVKMSGSSYGRFVYTCTQCKEKRFISFIQEEKK